MAALPAGWCVRVGRDCWGETLGETEIETEGGRGGQQGGGQTVVRKGRRRPGKLESAPAIWGSRRGGDCCWQARA